MCLRRSRLDVVIPLRPPQRQSNESVKSTVCAKRIATALPVRLRSQLSCAHADALDGLEEFAFGFNRGRDDDFGFLEFVNAGGADVAHAGGDGADEVLGAVVHSGGAEKDLAE